MKKLSNLKRVLAVILAAGMIACSVEMPTLADDIGDGAIPVMDAPVMDVPQVDVPEAEPIVEPGPVVVQPVQLPIPAVIVSIANKLIGNIPEGGVISYDNGATWSAPVSGGALAITDGTISALQPGSRIMAKQLGDNVMTLDSDPQIVTLTDADFPAPPVPVIVPVKLPTPNAAFEASTMILAGVPSPGAYSLNGGGSWVQSSGSFPISGVSADSEILVKALGDNVTTLDSDPQTIYITKADKPTGVATNPVVTAGGTGSIVHVSADMEYRPSGTSSWLAITGTTVSGLAGGDYDIRVRAAGTMLASDSITVTIDVRPMTKQDKPNAVFSGANMVLSQISVGMAISYNGGAAWETITDSHCTSATLTAAQAAQAISSGGIQVKRLGDGQTTLDSDVQIAAISKASTPSGISATAATSGNNGTINNVATDMQYIKEGTSNWIDIGSNKITGLAAGTYDVRRRANGSMIASDICKVSVGSNPVNPTVKEATPTANFNAMNLTLSNVRGLRYSVDGGGNYRDIGNTDNIAIPENELHTDKGLRLYRPGNGSTTINSDIQYIELHRQGVPSGISAISATNVSGGIIKGVNAGMEYKPANASGWSAIGGDTLSGLPQGTYYIRTRGAYQNLPSEAISVVINMTAAPAPVVPTPVTPTPAVTVKPEETKKPAATTTKKENSTSGKTQAEIDAEKNASDEAAKAEAEKLREESAQASASENSVNTEQTADSAQTVQPVLASAPDQKGWGAIEAHMDSAPVAVEMNGTTEVPGTVLATAKQTGSELILGMSNDVVWSIQSSAISDNVTDIDMGIVENAATIPQEVLAGAASDGKVEKQFDLKHEGDFGFAANLTVKVSADAIGKYANLLYYNKATNAMEVIGSSLVNDKSEATFLMTHASSYAVVVTEKEMKQAESAPSSPANVVKSEKKSSGWIWFAVIAILVLVIAIAIVVYMRKKQELEDKRRKARRTAGHTPEHTIQNVQHHRPEDK